MNEARRMSWSEVCARRLSRHGLATPLDGAPADVAAAMCGAHAQVMSAAELSLCLRLPAATQEDIREALWAERTLVKTFGPRGTVHLLPTRDLPLWTGALSAVPPLATGLPEDARMSSEQSAEVIAAIGHALEDAEPTAAVRT